MAISLGDAALAFAGGAATEYNTQQAEKRQSATRMEERNKELAEMHQYRVAETRFTNELARDLEIEQHQKALQSYRTPEEQEMYYRTRVLGEDPTVAARRMSQGANVDFSSYLTKPVRVKDTLTAGKEAVQGDTRMEGRVQKFGEVLRNYQSDNVSTRTLERRPSDETVTRTLEDRPQDSLPDMSAWLPPSTEEGVKVGDGYYAQRVDPETGEISVRTVIDPAADSTSYTETKDLYINSAGQLTRLVKGDGNKFFEPGSDQPVDMSQYTLNDPEVIKDEVVRLQNERTSLEQNISSGVDVTDNTRRVEEIDSRIAKLTAPSTETEDASMNASQRVLDQQLGRLQAADTGLRSLKRLSDISEAQIGGVPGAIAGVAGRVSTTIRGLSDSLNLTEGKKDSEMIMELQAAGLDLKDPRITGISFVSGMRDAEKLNMFYSIASAMRESGRRDISNADVERAVDLVNKMSGSSSFQGAMVQLETIFKSRVQEVSREVIMNPDASRDVTFRASTQYARSVDGWEENVDYLINPSDKSVYVNMGPNEPVMPLKDFIAEFDTYRGF